MSNPDVSKYKKVDERSHVLLRAARYVGAITPATKKTWFIRDGQIETGTLTASPAFHKLFDEIISNSSDHSKTPEGKALTEIRVYVDQITGEIKVFDNGGIPVLLHPEYDQYIPEMIFGELRSGSNFDDNEDSISTGQNGEGASLTNIFSREFKVETALNGKRFVQVFTNNMSERTVPEVTDYTGINHTCITFEPDYPRLEMPNGLSEDDILLIKRRCHEIAFTNPKLKVYFNGEQCAYESFHAFVKAYDKDASFQATDRWNVGVGFSKTGFNHISYVNSTPSFDGGTHIDYVVDKIIEVIRAKIKKATKQDVRPADIKNNLTLFVDCTINNPRYNSQTKEKLVTGVSAYGSKFELTEKFINAITASKAVEDIIEWAKRKQELEESKEVEESLKSIRKQGFYDIPKYRPATSKDRSNCILFLAEGDSAKTVLDATTDPKIHGIFPLRGKPENCFEKGVKKVLSEEILHILTIMNLSLTNTDYDKLRYQKIVLATDFDNDGIHIRGLLILFFSKFFPNLLKEGRIQLLNTPDRIVTYKGKEYDFYKDEDYLAFIDGKTNYKTKYCKGLGSHKEEKFETFLNNPDCFVAVDYDPERDLEHLSLAFDQKRPDDRKEWVAVM